VYVSTVDVYGYPRVACDETHPIQTLAALQSEQRAGRRGGVGRASFTWHACNGGAPGQHIWARSKDFVLELHVS